MKKLIAVSVLCAVAGLLAGVAAGAESKTVYKIVRLSSKEVGILCQNGGDPAMLEHKVTNFLVVSCGE